MTVKESVLSELKDPRPAYHARVVPGEMEVEAWKPSC